jgi:hypothetical protein
VVFDFEKAKLQDGGLGPDVEFGLLCGGSDLIAGVAVFEGEGDVIRVVQEEGFVTDLSEYLDLMVMMHCVEQVVEDRSGVLPPGSLGGIPAVVKSSSRSSTSWALSDYTRTLD